MRKSFKNFIEEHNLVPPKSKILLAVSGGVDSMVMLYLFKECGYSFSVAHCNFKLRGTESDGDEALVRETCNTIGVELFVKEFETKAYVKEKDVSIQVAARELRYSWFNELAKNNGFSLVAVAHNKNDIAETILINLCRGTGLKGLTGIKPKANEIIRPLLFAQRDEIEDYAKLKGIIHRIDSSNVDVKYARNRLRHKVLPELEIINKGVVENLYTTTLYLSESWKAIEGFIESFRKEVIKREGEELQYSIEKLIHFSFRQIFLVEEFVPYGFPASMALDIEKSLFSQAGKVFYSDEYQLVRDRQSLVLTKRNHNKIFSMIIIDQDTKIIEQPIALSFEIIKPDEKFSFPKSNDIAVLDYSLLTFPLTIRPWREGDWFIPFGMKGRKKISDFLIDRKVPLHRKDSVFVIESDNQIVWVVGYRADNRFKVEKGCSKIFMISIL